jgi:hypothetical protein
MQARCPWRKSKTQQENIKAKSTTIQNHMEFSPDFQEYVDHNHASATTPPQANLTCVASAPKPGNSAPSQSGGGFHGAAYTD